MLNCARLESDASSTTSDAISVRGEICRPVAPPKPSSIRSASVVQRAPKRLSSALQIYKAHSTYVTTRHSIRCYRLLRICTYVVLSPFRRPSPSARRLLKLTCEFQEMLRPQPGCLPPTLSTRFSFSVQSLPTFAHDITIRALPPVLHEYTYMTSNLTIILSAQHVLQS